MADAIERVVGDIATIDELHIDLGFTGSRLTQRLAKTGTLVLSKPRTVQPNRGFFDKRELKVDLQAKTATCPSGQVIAIEIGVIRGGSPRAPAPELAADAAEDSMALATLGTRSSSHKSIGVFLRNLRQKSGRAEE